MSLPALFLTLLACSGEVLGPGGPGDPGQPGAEPAGKIVFALDRLHEVDITVDAANLDALENDRENRVPCTIVYDGIRVDSVGIRQKGGYGSSSSLDQKPGFSLKFNEFVPGGRLDGMKRLLLNNAKEDPTFLSEHIGYEAYRMAGLAAPLTAHALVTLNGTRYGIMVVKEAIGDDFLDRNFGPENDQGNVYEGFYHPEDQSLGDFVLHPEELDLKDEVEEQRTRTDVTALAAAVNGTSDAEFAGKVGALLDLDRYITGFALDTILGYWDSYAYFLNNYFLYDNPADGRFVYIPHGMDQLQYQSPGSPMGRLPQRIRAIPALDQKFQAERTRLRGAWDAAAMQARIDAVSAILHAQPMAAGRPSDDLASFDDRVQGVRDAVAGLGTP